MSYVAILSFAIVLKKHKMAITQLIIHELAKILEW